MRTFTKYPQGYVKASGEQMSIFDLEDPHQITIDEILSESSNSQIVPEDEQCTMVTVEFDYDTPISMKSLVSCAENIMSQYGYVLEGFFIRDFKGELINDYNEAGFSEWINPDAGYDVHFDLFCAGNLTDPVGYGTFSAFKRAFIRGLKALGCDVVNIDAEFGI